MAEQISLEKTQVELELTQVKQQLERQQDRIKGIHVRFAISTSTFICPGLLNVLNFDSWLKDARRKIISLYKQDLQPFSPS